MFTTRTTPLNFKTRLCVHFERGNCNRGDSCTFAHGKSELRQFKRSPCWYHEHGGCKKSDEECDFEHVPHKPVVLAWEKPEPVPTPMTEPVLDLEAQFPKLHDVPVQEAVWHIEEPEPEPELTEPAIDLDSFPKLHDVPVQEAVWPIEEPTREPEVIQSGVTDWATDDLLQTDWADDTEAIDFSKPLFETKPRNVRVQQEKSTSDATSMDIESTSDATSMDIAPTSIKISQDMIIRKLEGKVQQLESQIKDLLQLYTLKQAPEELVSMVKTIIKETEETK